MPLSKRKQRDTILDKLLKFKDKEKTRRNPGSFQGGTVSGSKFE